MRPKPQLNEKDEVYERLRPLVEVEQTSYLWVEGDTPPFTPRLLPSFFGDGRALFTLATINQRPCYWIVRVDSSWESGMDRESGDGPDFAEFTDEILTALEEAFGNGRCGYSGESLFYPREERLANCQCEECDDDYVAEWPEVDGYGGCSWGRMDWPDEFATERHPLSRVNLLAVPAPVAA